jgi:hypothetical protein
MEKQETCVGPGRHWFSEDCTAHIAVSSWFEQQGAPNLVRVTFHPVTFLHHRLPRRPWNAFDNQPQRLPGDVRIDGFQRLAHAPSLLDERP